MIPYTYHTPTVRNVPSAANKNPNARPSICCRFQIFQVPPKRSRTSLIYRGRHVDGFRGSLVALRGLVVACFPPYFGLYEVLN
eukprot:452603-Amorphochlora_amoeboformis.AAC.2